MSDKAPKCPECEEGLPLWMGTFSDLVTLLLTFFVLLLSFAKTETAKYESALGSIRKAFGGNTRVAGEVLTPGKSPDDSPTMIDSQDDVKPFPIDFLTTEGFLDKHEINRESDEQLIDMRKALKDYELADFVDVYEESEGIKVRVKENIMFEEGSAKISSVNIEVFEKLIKLLREQDWNVFVEGHAAKGEKESFSGLDSFAISAQRATAVSRVLMQKGVAPEKVTTLFYGDTRPQRFSVTSIRTRELQRRVEFMIRKKDIRALGHKVSPR
jgi:chemotaxis protein MotB